ncbi:MAG TPA: SCO family protein [Steroidobacteraceae bacterium]|nr:SCO family protein [Steroidobacteraceae bacterium]
MSKPLLMMVMMLSAALALAEPGTNSTASPQLKAGVLSPVMPAPPLGLQGTDGRPLDLAKYRGKVVLLAFGFSSCGEVCPITLATLAGARRKLGAAADRVQVVYVTVDPERDTAERMKKFLGSFDPTFVGGVGTPEAIDAAKQRYGVSSKKITYPDGSYTIGHSSSIFLIDRTGGLHAVMPYGHTVDDFVHDLEILLRS